MWDDPCRPPGSNKPRGSCCAWRTTRSSGSCAARPCAATRPSSRWPGTASWGIEPLAALGVDGDPSELLELFWDRQLPNTVLCTHGEMIGRLFARLTTGQGLVAPAPLVWPKGSAWLLHRTDWRQLHARYLSPLALEHRVPTS
jgi:hypothetical protein